VARASEGSNFPAPFSNELRIFRPVVEQKRILAQKVVARDAGHLFKTRIDENHVLAVVNDDDSFVERLENARHLFEPFGPFKFQGHPRTPALGVNVHLTQSAGKPQSWAALRHPSTSQLPTAGWAP
jgi:hypothetical protein